MGADILTPPLLGNRWLSLFLREDPLDQRLGVAVRHGLVRRHGGLAPHALAALLHLVEELRFSLRVTAVLGRHILVGRADQLLVHGMAGEAVVLLRQLFLRIRGQRGGQREDDYSSLHGFSLQAVFNCMRSLMGSKHITPRHSQPLTGSGRGGLSSAAGSPRMPSGRASTTVSGRDSRAKSSRQRASSSPRPRSKRPFG